MKNLLLKILKILLGKKSASLPKPSQLFTDKNLPYKILVVRQHNQLGDMLLSNSLFRSIKEHLPSSFLSVVASKENFPAIESNQFIDLPLLFDKSKVWNPSKLSKFFNYLRSQRFDFAIVPITVSISFTSCLLARLSGSKILIGPESLDGKPNKYAFMFDYRIDVGKENDSRHISEKILDIVRPFGIITSDLSEHILINEGYRKFAIDFFKNVTNLKVGVHIGAGKVQNRWHLKNFVEVIYYLFEKYNAFVYLTIGNWEREMVDKIIPELKKEPIVLKNFPIPKLAAIIELSDLFISNDTGIMHVAGSTNTPLIALFGPTNPEIWGPVGKNKFLIRKGSNINDIKVEDIIQKIDEVLKNNK